MKNLYNELNLKEIYETYESEQYENLKEKINNIDLFESDDNRGITLKIKELLNLYFKKIFKRNS